jgi:hypothetical protein
MKLTESITKEMEKEIKKAFADGMKSSLQLYKIGFMAGLKGNKKLMKLAEELKLSKEEVKEIMQ